MTLSLALSLAMMTSSGGLLSEPALRSARLLDTPSTALGVVLGQGGERQMNLEAMTRAELEMERLRLIDSRPSVVPGIIVGSVGAAVLLTGMVLIAVTDGLGAGLVGAVLILGGLAGLVTGVIMTIVAAIQSGVIGARIRRVEQRINTVIRDGGLAPPEDGPPPPPPPGVWRDVPQPALVRVATF